MGYGYGAGVRRGLRSQGGKSGTSSKSNLKEELEKTSPADKEGRTWKELIVLATLKLAMKGNAAALREVWERVDGKVRQVIGGDVDLHTEISRRLTEARHTLVEGGLRTEQWHTNRNTAAW